MIEPNDPRGALVEARDDLQQLKTAHGAFVRTYSEIHREVDGKVLLRPTVDAHFRRGLRLLRKEYAHAAVAAVDSPERKEWLKAEAEELKEFESTFDRRWMPRALSGRMLSVVPGVEIVLGIAGLSGLSSIGALISGTCLCEVLRFVPMVVIAIVCFLGVTSFDEKRKLFIENHVYDAEDAVYRALGAKKQRERSLWGVGFAVISATLLAAAVLETIAIKNHLFLSHNQEVHGAFFVISLAITVVIFLYTRNRTPA